MVRTVEARVIFAPPYVRRGGCRVDMTRDFRRDSRTSRRRRGRRADRTDGLGGGGSPGAPRGGRSLPRDGDLQTARRSRPGVDRHHHDAAERPSGSAMCSDGSPTSVSRAVNRCCPHCASPSRQRRSGVRRCRGARPRHPPRRPDDHAATERLSCYRHWQATGLPSDGGRPCAPRTSRTRARPGRPSRPLVWQASQGVDPDQAGP
jgi:hypothetical protein